MRNPESERERPLFRFRRELVASRGRAATEQTFVPRGRSWFDVLRVSRSTVRELKPSRQIHAEPGLDRETSVN